MSDEFDAFIADDGGEPPDGTHTAWLERTSVFQSRDGRTFIRTCWRTTDSAYYWETLNGVAGGGRPHTKRLLGALGVDLVKAKSFDEVGDELATLENVAYTVNVARNGEYLNTTVEGRPGIVQPEIPISDHGLPPAAEPAVTAADFAGKQAGDLFGDDDIPF
jgi:hypothetical protein